MRKEVPLLKRLLAMTAAASIVMSPVVTCAAESEEDQFATFEAADAENTSGEEYIEDFQTELSDEIIQSDANDEEDSAVVSDNGTEEVQISSNELDSVLIDDETEIQAAEVENSDQPAIITGFEDFDVTAHYITISDSARPLLDNLTAEMPQSLLAYVNGDGQAIEIPVSWEAVGDDYSKGDAYYYQFSPVFDSGKYQLSDQIDLILKAPYVGVFVTVASPSASAKGPRRASSVTGKSAETAVYQYLTSTMGLNTAAACGVMANIQSESGFNPNALGDGGTSYGICQWHNSRWTRLKNYAPNDWSTINGQLRYLNYELQNYYPRVLNYLRSVSNDSSGAYSASYYWCYNFEVPANRGTVSVTRGNLARDKYWPVYRNIQPVGAPHLSIYFSNNVVPGQTMGDVFNGSGKLNNFYYLCYKMTNSQTGEIYPEGNYSVTLELYKPDGSLKNSYTYNNSPENWIAANFDQSGRWKGIAKVSGDWTGEVSAELNIPEEVILPTAQLKYYFSDNVVPGSTMGDSYTGTAKYGQTYYFCYRMLENGTNHTIPEGDYSVKLQLYDPDGSEVVSYTYDKSPENWIRYGLNKAGKWKGVVTVSGAYSGTASTEIVVTPQVIAQLQVYYSTNVIPGETMGDEYSGDAVFGDLYYLCYTITDKNTGSRITDNGYKVTMAFEAPDGYKISHTYSDSPANWLRYNLNQSGVWKGTVTVSGAYNGTYTCNITVQPESTIAGSISKRGIDYRLGSADTVLVNGLSLSDETLSLETGTSGKVSAYVSPSNATTKLVSWRSSDTDIVQVDSYGTVWAIRPGTADITAISLDGGYTATCHVIVTEKTPKHNWESEKTIDWNPTCTASGQKSTHCSDCDAILQGSEEEIPALGHDWQTPTYEWSSDYSSCTAKRVCHRDPSHVESEQAVVTTSTMPATTTAEGKKTYTATFSNSTFTTQTVEVTIPKIETEAPTQPSTEAPTQPSTEAPTQPSTEAPAQPSTPSVQASTTVTVPTPVQPTEAITISKKPSSVKVKASAKGKVKVSWKKITKQSLKKQIKKAQVQYGTSKTGTLKTKTISGKKTSVTLKLAKKKTYYIRVRYSDGKGRYSGWTGWKKVKTKK